MRRTVFKIVEVRPNGKRVSYNNPDSDEHVFGSVVVYERDRVTIPNEGCGPLLAFATLDEATKFLRTMGHWTNSGMRSSSSRPIEIWRARGVESKKRVAWDRGGNRLDGDGVPNGTIFVDDLTLVSRIKTSRGITLA